MTHFYSKYISLCIYHIDGIQMHAIARKHINQSAKHVIKLKCEYEAEMKKNSISKSKIEIHMTNCTTKLGCQIKLQSLAQHVALSDNNKK